MADLLLNLQNITLTFGGRPVLDGAELMLHDNDRMCLVGRNGSGKSTLLKIAAGLVEQDHGTRWLQPATTLRYLPQEPDFTGYTSVLEYVVQGLGPTDDPYRCRHYLNELGLSGEEDPAKLSGGEARRAALARTLAPEPDILLLDEPLGALDANLRKSIQNELKLLQRRLGITFVFVTHAQSEALALSDRIVVMNAGRIEQISGPFELYSRPKTLFVARFIGRNAVIAGTIKSVAGDGVTVDTAFGELTGKATAGRPLVGCKASLAIPAETIDVLPSWTAAAYIADTYGAGPIKGNIDAIQQIGHIVQLAIRIGEGEPIIVEGHADKYAGRLNAGEDVLLAWKPEAATLIAHAPGE